MTTFTPDRLAALVARFERYLVSMPGGCRVWTGAKSKGGQRPWSGPYGSFWVDKEHNTVRAHVFAAFVAGKLTELRLPPGLQLDHTCDHGTLCVDCTELVPGSENLKRGRAKGRKKMTCHEERVLSSP